MSYTHTIYIILPNTQGYATVMATDQRLIGAIVSRKRRWTAYFIEKVNIF